MNLGGLQADLKGGSGGAEPPPQGKYVYCFSGTKLDRTELESALKTDLERALKTELESALKAPGKAVVTDTDSEKAGLNIF